ncbi:MAG: DUF4443 domain-containing protein [Thaumarchaeota archaeon]|nr:DUF4443 domain-containing protein [Candidatus Calditenuaceae archaeon]MDW8186469.1 DUF4443 domain-containing protein [Nitrososphaerota archaeon]
MRTSGLEDLSLLFQGVERAGTRVNFGPVIYLRTLYALNREIIMSRSALSVRLGVGEGTVRTIVRKLAQRGLVEVIRSGCTLSERGREFMQNLRAFITEPTPLLLEEVWKFAHSVGVAVRGGAGSVGKGLEERDQAIRHGAEAAIVLSYVSGKLLMPEVSDVSAEHPAFARKVEDQLLLRDGDVVLIAGAQDLHAAESGAVGAALYLTSKLVLSRSNADRE